MHVWGEMNKQVGCRFSVKMDISFKLLLSVVDLAAPIYIFSSSSNFFDSLCFLLIVYS